MSTPGRPKGECRSAQHEGTAVSALLDELARGARAWLPARTRINDRERWRAVGGALLGLLVTALACRHWGGSLGGARWLIAPLGASAVLVFALPASPLAQPWPVIAGNTLSALVGIAWAHALPDPAWAGPLASATAIGLMFAMRCLHPPGGAMALLAVLDPGTPLSFALFPALANSVLLVLAGVLYNNLTGRRYPHMQLPARHPTPKASFASADLEAALARYNQVLDISQDDLEALIEQTEIESYRRRLGSVPCRDIMSREPATVGVDTPLQQAWSLMGQRRVKALPVVDAARRVVGIVTRADFLRQLDLRLHEGLGGRMRDFLRATRKMVSRKPAVVGHIMTRQVGVANEDLPVVELMPLFSEGGHHHIPIVDGEGGLVGMITQSDFVRALSRAIGPAS